MNPEVGIRAGVQDKPLPPAVARLLRLSLALCGAFCAAMSTGCSSLLPDRTTCAVVLLVDGQQLRPSPQEFAEVRQKLSPRLAAEGMEFVRDTAAGEMLAVVEIRAQATTPEMREIVVHSLRRNPYYVVAGQQPPAKVYAPSADEVNREQQRLMSSMGASPNSNN